MSDKRFRIILFALGIALGIIVGAFVVFYFIEKKTSSAINENNLVNKISNNVLSFLSSKKKEVNTDSVLKGKSLLHDVSFSQQNSTKITEDEIEKELVYVLDTSNEGIEVKKDELIKIVALDFAVKTEKKSIKVDSILNNVAGVTNEKINNSAKIFVEFWQSPINYRGYKMTKNKLILFGIEPNNAKKIISQNDKMYLICSDWAFKLDFTNDFKSLDKISINEL